MVMIGKLASALLLGAAMAAFAAWQWLPSREQTPYQQPIENAQLAALKDKIAELDRQLKATTFKLTELEQYVASSNPGWALLLEEESAAEVLTEVEADTLKAFQPTRAGNSNRSVEQIEASGLTIDEYEALDLKAQQMYVSEFEAQWLRRRERFQRSDHNPDSMELLREGIGDDAFDRYLYASGRSNRVKLNRVIKGSAAEQAGLNRGDVVLSYDDKRVFRRKELKRLSYEGEPGESVVLRVKGQDGNITQMVIPRGPIVFTEYGGWREVPGN
jgi:C-terminal processing protease CtpA/Prc